MLILRRVDWSFDANVDAPAHQRSGVIRVIDPIRVLLSSLLGERMGPITLMTRIQRNVCSSFLFEQRVAFTITIGCSVLFVSFRVLRPIRVHRPDLLVEPYEL